MVQPFGLGDTVTMSGVMSSWATCTAADHALADVPYGRDRCPADQPSVVGCPHGLGMAAAALRHARDATNRGTIKAHLQGYALSSYCFGYCSARPHPHNPLIEPELDVLHSLLHRNAILLRACGRMWAHLQWLCPSANRCVAYPSLE